MLAFAGGICSASFAQHGSMLNSDSAAFVAVAENFVARRGLTLPYSRPQGPFSPVAASAFDGAVPLVQWPPLFPLAMAVASPGDVRQGGRAVNALCGMASLYLIGLLVRRLAGGSFAPANLAVAVLAFGPTPGEAWAPAMNAWLTLHSKLTTEPLFLATTFAALLALAIHLERGSTAALLVAGGAASLACLTRYPGAALVVAGGLAMLSWRARPPAGRVGAALVFCALAVLPIASWLVVLGSRHGMLSPRPTTVHWPSLAALGFGLRTIGGWGLPLSGAFAAKTVAGVAALLVAGAIARRSWRSGRRDAATTAHVVLWFCASYLALLLATRSFFDAGISLNSRILSPLQPLVYGLLAIGLHRLVRTRLGARAAAATLLVVATVIALAAAPRIRSAMQARTRAGESKLARLYGADLRRVLEGLPADTLLVSNLPAKVYELTRRPAIHVPPVVKIHLGGRNPDLDAELAGLHGLLATRPSAVVFFQRADYGVLLSRDRAEKALDLELAWRSPRVSIYRGRGDPFGLQVRRSSAR